KTSYEIDSTLEGRFFDRRKLTWWEKEGKFVKNEKVLKEIYRIKESDGFREDLKKAYPDPPGYEDEDFLKEIDDTVSTLYESSSDEEKEINSKNKNRVTFSTKTTKPPPPPLPPKTP